MLIDSKCSYAYAEKSLLRLRKTAVMTFPEKSDSGAHSDINPPCSEDVRLIEKSLKRGYTDKREKEREAPAWSQWKPLLTPHPEERPR